MICRWLPLTRLRASGKSDLATQAGEMVHKQAKKGPDNESQNISTNRLNWCRISVNGHTTLAINFRAAAHGVRKEKQAQLAALCPPKNV